MPSDSLESLIGTSKAMRIFNAINRRIREIVDEARSSGRSTPVYISESGLLEYVRGKLRSEFPNVPPQTIAAAVRRVRRAMLAGEALTAVEGNMTVNPAGIPEFTGWLSAVDPTKRGVYFFKVRAELTQPDSNTPLFREFLIESKSLLSRDQVKQGVIDLIMSQGYAPRSGSPPIDGGFGGLSDIVVLGVWRN